MAGEYKALNIQEIPQQFNFDDEVTKLTLRQPYDKLKESDKVEIMSLVNQFENISNQEPGCYADNLKKLLEKLKLDESEHSSLGFPKFMVGLDFLTYIICAVKYNTIDPTVLYEELFPFPLILLILTGLSTLCCGIAARYDCQSNEINETLINPPKLKEILVNISKAIVDKSAYTVPIHIDNSDKRGFLIGYINLKLKKIEFDNSQNSHVGLFIPSALPLPSTPQAALFYERQPRLPAAAAAAAASSLDDNSQPGLPAAAASPPSHTTGFSR